jgi:general secretion pathway protein G
MARKGPSLRSRRLRGEGGFSLLEVLAVVVIVLVLAGLMFGMMNVVEKQRISSTQTQIHTLRCAVSEYRTIKGSLPQRLEDLAQKLDQAVPMKDGKFVDAWGQPFVYQVDGREFKVWSCGPDGKPDTDDDVRYEKN